MNTDYGPNYIGNVIRILDTETLVVNVGKDVLSTDDKIQIYEVGPELTDVDGSFLCNFEFIKDELTVKEVNEHYSICKKTKIVSPGRNLALSLSPLLAHNIVIYEPLNVLDNDLQPLQIKDPIIHVGDPIKHA